MRLVERVNRYVQRWLLFLRVILFLFRPCTTKHLRGARHSGCCTCLGRASWAGLTGRKLWFWLVRWSVRSRLVWVMGYEQLLEV
jgi:hypothetical protein